MKIMLINPAQVDEVWFSIKDMVANCLEYCDGKFELDDIRVNIPHRRQQLWIAFEEEEDKIYGFVITEISQYPRKRVLSLGFAGGIFGEYLRWREPLMEALYDFARISECDFIEIYGRPALHRMFRVHNSKLAMQVTQFDIPKKENDVDTNLQKT